MMFFCRHRDCLWIYWYFNYHLQCHGPIANAHCPLRPQPGGTSSPTAGSAAATICKFKLSLCHSIYQQIFRVRYWNENLLDQRVQEATSWPSFLIGNSARVMSLQLSQTKKKPKFQVPALLFPIHLSIHTPGSSGLSMANSSLLVTGSTPWAKIYFI